MFGDVVKMHYLCIRNRNLRYDKRHKGFYSTTEKGNQE